MASFKQKFVSSVEMLDGMEDRLKKHKQTNLMHLMHLIKSPLFKQLVAVEESIEELAIIAKRRELQTENFDIKLSNGKLIYFSRNASHRKPVVTSRSASVKRSKSRKREKSEKKDSIKNNKIDFFTFTSTTDQFKTETFPLISLNEGSKRGVASMEASTESFGKLEKITKTNEDSSQTKENTNSPIDCAVDDSHESEFEGKFLEKYEAFEVLNDKKERLGYVMTEVNGDLKKEKSGNYEKLIKVGDNWVGAETNKLDLIKLLQNHHLKLRTKKHPGFENDCKTNNFDLIPLFENNKTETITANRAETESNGINTPHTVNSSTKTDASVGINQNPFSNYCTNLINNLNNSDETKSTHTPCLTSINATCEPNDTLYYLTTYPESFPNSLIVSDNEIKNDSSKLKTLLTLDTPVFTNNNTALTHGTKQTTTLPQPTKGNLKFSPKPTNKIINEHSDGLKTHFSFKPNSDPRHQIKLNDHNSTTQLHHSSLFYTESPPAGIQTKQENSSVTPKPKNFRTLKNFLSLNKTHKANIDQGIKANDDEKNELKINENKKIDENNNLDSVLDNRFCCRSTASVEDRMVLNTEWTQLKLLHLVNNGSGLGFGIIGGKSTGVVVKTIQEGGAADLDNTLKIGDHILQICDVNVRGLASEQVAAVLRQSGAHVRLLVARPLEELPLDIEQLDNGMYGSSMFAPVVPTRHLSQHIDQLNAMMSAYPDFIGFHEDGVLIERQEFEGGSTENSYEHTFPVMHKDQMNDSSDCVKTSSNVDFSTSSLNMSHDCEASINKSKTPKRLSLATVFEMSPLDISEQHINYSNEKEHSEKDKSLISRSEKSENETKTKIPSGNFQKPFDPPDVVESLECCVVKGEHGLGMAVVGYASDDENLTGLFVGSIVDGSDVFEKGLIKVNDQITALNGESIIGLSNQEVVDILKNSDREVTISIARHISGKKHDLLKCSSDFCRKSFVCEGRRRSSLRKLELATQRNDDAIKNEWKKFFESKKRKLEENGENFEKNDLNENEEELQIIVAHVMKLKQGGGLGMVLEGLMDDTGTFHPFHFIRSIYPRGPIAVNDKLKVGDEVLEVNGIRIHGTNRNGVVGILKNLPQSVCIVVARQKNRRKNYLQKTCKKNDKVSKFDELPVLNFGNNINNYMKSATFNDNLNRQNFKNIATNNEQHNGVKNSSTNKQDVETNKNVRLRSLSLEPVSKYKIWCDEVVTVELEKADAGLGFSVMEYKDLSNQNKSMILIRSLVPGGVTHKSRKIFPGDRLVFVNRISLYEANLNAAMAALKTTPKGKVVLGILKPLSIEPNTNDSFHEGSDRSKRYSQLETLSCDHFNNAFQKTNLSMSDSSSLLSLSPLLSPSFPSPAHLKNSQNSFHIRNDEAPLEFYLQHFYSNVSSPMSNASFPYDTNVPGRSKESDKTNRTPLNYSYDYSCCTKPYKLPLSSFQPSNLAYFNRPFSSPQHSKNNGKVFNNFPHSANFINSKKFKSEKTILNLDEMLFKASVPTSYSDTGMPNNFQHKQYFPKAISCSQKHFLQKHELQSKHKKANSKTSLQSPQKASIYPSVSASFSSPSSFLFRTDSKQTSILPLETISIKKENLPLGLSIEAYNLTQNPAKPLTNSIKANIGFIIKKISLGSVKKDGRLRVGDVIVAIGGTSVEGLTTFQAKSLLRNAMLTSDKIEITYLSGDSTNGCGKMAFNATVAEHLNKYFQE